MKSTSLNTLINSFSVDEIEKNLIYNFVKENSIDYSDSCYISTYLRDFIPNETLINEIKLLNHNKIEDIVVDMELLMPHEDKKRMVHSSRHNI